MAVTAASGTRIALAALATAVTAAALVAGPGARVPVVPLAAASVRAAAPILAAVAGWCFAVAAPDRVAAFAAGAGAAVVAARARAVARSGVTARDPAWLPAGWLSGV